MGMIGDALGAGDGGGDDEEAVDEAVAEMYAMCANPGQEAIIGRGEQDFRDWAGAFLEFPGVDPINMEDSVGPEQYAATSEIWAQGKSMVFDQSGFHDTEDETGEGTGDEHSSTFDRMVDLVQDLF